mmetsp:Transcript_5502/g.7721  ORF Transcript_5502/g.7721 Transcript_5502/m.7721 type:complete len:231 (-) Transcript_5502:85-777(-)
MYRDSSAQCNSSNVSHCVAWVLNVRLFHCHEINLVFPLSRFHSSYVIVSSIRQVAQINFFHSIRSFVVIVLPAIVIVLPYVVIFGTNSIFLQWRCYFFYRLSFFVGFVNSWILWSFYRFLLWFRSFNVHWCINNSGRFFCFSSFLCNNVGSLSLIIFFFLGNSNLSLFGFGSRKFVGSSKRTQLLLGQQFFQSSANLSLKGSFWNGPMGGNVFANGLVRSSLFSILIGRS